MCVCVTCRASTGSNFGGEEREEVEGGERDSAMIGSLLAQYPNLARYPPSSLFAISCLATRKMSDSVVITRKEPSVHSQRHRCVSDSVAPCIALDDDKNSEVGGWSHLYCDSGYNDEKSSRCHGSNSSAYVPSPRVSLFSSDLLSQEEGTDGSHHSFSKPHRRLTPYMNSALLKEETVVNHDDQQYQFNSGQTSASGTMVHPRAVSYTHLTLPTIYSV